MGQGEEGREGLTASECTRRKNTAQSIEKDKARGKPALSQGGGRSPGKRGTHLHQQPKKHGSKTENCNCTKDRNTPKKGPRSKILGRGERCP